MSGRQRTIGESVTLRGDLDRIEEEGTMKRNDGGPAFPGDQGYTSDGLNSQSWCPGMTLREWYAGQAIKLFSLDMYDVHCLKAGGMPDHQIVARFCYQLADAMIAEGAKPPEDGA